jgi:transcriptional regulator GlxA family with amidase domain
MNAKVRGTCFRLVRASESRVKQIIELVEDGTAYTIRELAQRVRLSPSHTQRLFKQETGRRLGEWLIEQRLQRAALLLQHSYLSVKEITHTVEYGHVSSFTRAFERRFGDSPTIYRSLGSSSDTKVSAARYRQRVFG